MYTLTTVAVCLLVAAVALLVFRKSKALKKSAAHGNFFESSHGSIFYTRSGSKSRESLIFIHGIGGSGYSWRLLAPRFEGQYDVIVLDLWGFGRSHKSTQQRARHEIHSQILLELLDNLGIKRAHLAGASMGGAIAFWFSLIHPRRVLDIVTFAPAAHPRLVPSFAQKMSWLSHLTPLMINRSTIEKILDRIYTDKSLIHEESIEAYLRPYIEKQTHKTFSNHLELIKDPRVFDNLENLSVPTLTLWGANDKMVVRRTMDAIIQRLPETQFHRHSTAGHHVMEEDPSWCEEKMRSFWKVSRSSVNEDV